MGATAAGERRRRGGDAAGPGSYVGALRQTLRQLSAAYGYALTVATTLATLNGTHGPPSTGDLFLFAAGGLLAFGALDGVLELLPHGEDRSPPSAFPFAGVLNFVSVAAGLGAATGIAHAVGSPVAWLLAPLAATAVYLVLVALQVTAVGALRR